MACSSSQALRFPVCRYLYTHNYSISPLSVGTLMLLQMLLRMSWHQHLLSSLAKCHTVWCCS